MVNQPQLPQILMDGVDISLTEKAMMSLMQDKKKP